MFDFNWITPALAVGARFSDEHVQLLATEHRVGAVIDLREEACDDAVLLDTHGVAFLHLPTPDTFSAPVAVLHAGVAFATHHIGARRRVLIHCQHGVGRSALLALCVLVAGGLAPLEALELAKLRRAAVSPSEAQYEGWAAWLRDTGRRAPTFAEFAAIAYRHLRSA
jgi:hypothetical protein